MTEAQDGEAAGPGTRIAGRYEVVEVLGQGSFGRTFLARDEREGGKLVAIKQLHARGPELLKRHELFEREAAVLRALRHHGIPAIHEHLQVAHAGGEEVYLVMEYIEGVSLATMIGRREHLAPGQLIDLLLGLLDILEYLHGRAPPVLHRDIKPANVIVRPGGGPAVVDFGAVRNVFKSADEGGSTIVGTYGYMPFEQYMGQASPASDLYALGATMLHLATGRPPSDFAGSDGTISVPEPLPGGEVLRAVLVRLLAPAASQRPASARAAREMVLAGVTAPTAAVALRGSERALAPATGALIGDRAELFEKLVLSPTQMMFPQRQRSDLTFAMTIGLLFLTIFTFGVVPLAYLSAFRRRSARLAHFLSRGEPAAARLLQVDKSAEWYEVVYEFEAGGARRRGSDKVTLRVARHWQPGDTVQVLYIAAEQYDSVVVSVS